YQKIMNACLANDQIIIIEIPLLVASDLNTRRLRIFAGGLIPLAIGSQYVGLAQSPLQNMPTD
ncbi:MAG: hypothetical protein WAU79_24345, partial [Bradyrhizobium sp.]|uniref:hypothetical protein n=1 Tax=Bradyrhizobium sp. TaxID=376 RepID=UPI003BB189EA